MSEPTLRQRIGKELAKFDRASRGPTVASITEVINREDPGKGYIAKVTIRTELRDMEEAVLVFSSRSNPAAAYHWHLSNLGRHKQEKGEL
jgi:hypothetical protein